MPLVFWRTASKIGAEESCDMRERGGFERIRSRGSEGPIEYEVYYREDGNSRPITYELSIDASERDDRPYVPVNAGLRGARGRAVEDPIPSSGSPAGVVSFGGASIKGSSRRRWTSRM